MRAILLLAICITGCTDVQDCLQRRCEQLCTKRATVDRSDPMRDLACTQCIATCYE